MTQTENRDCLVCGHGATEHGTAESTCVGVDGLCQCHGYDPDEHPAARLAAARDHRAVD